MNFLRILFPCLLLCSWNLMYADEEVDTAKHDPAEYLSNTLPVLYINTVDEAPIVDKENYIEGSYYLDANGCGDYESVGTVEEPLPLLIKGRGNATWRYPKKPYRLKLDSKASLLGMPKSKHWILLAAYSDWLAHGRNYLAFKISEKMEMPYTTGCVPCEVVLNGDYIGMYFLTEQIRIDKKRVNISEQEDGETDSTLITGGWLLEIDNYIEENQIRFIDPKKPDKYMKVTYHSPEELSEAQLSYLTEFINNVNVSVNTDDKASREWEEYIDIDALARFYMLEEALDHLEAFSGSSWFYKDRGENTKLIWGPIWDAGSTLGNRNQDVNTTNFIYKDEPDFAYNHWIEEIAKFPRFQIAIKKWWKKYRDEVYPTMQAEVDAYGELTEAALAADYLRWGDKSATQLWYYRNKYMRMLTNKRDFLASQWDIPADTINWVTYYSDTDLALPQGVNAYVAIKFNDNGVVISPVQYIPANVGVLLQGTNNFDEIAATPYEGETTTVSSILVGNVEPQVVNDGYVLFDNKFVLAPTDTPIEPHCCYIPVTSDDSTPTIINIIKEGDVDGDGVVTSSDVTCLYNYLLNGDSSDIVNGDQDGDGIITAADITIVYNILLGE
ncbi:MAG: CotH kinase family protein [Muribaculaceae bacterium]|nr:CotH kinase family protein [Muribaculaceae bacterium]